MRFGRKQSLLFLASMLMFSTLSACKGLTKTAVADLDTAIIDGVVTGERRIFVASTHHDGNFGGIAGADLHCNTVAQNVGLERSYKAFLATAAEDVEVRFAGSDAVYVFDSSGNRTLFCDTLDDFSTAGATCISPSLLRYEGGTLVLNNRIFTGKGNGGDPGLTCTDWTDNGAGVGHQAVTGITSGTNSALLSSVTPNCSFALAHLICISE